MTYKGFIITVHERNPGQWRARIARADGRLLKCEGSERTDFETMAAPTKDYALTLAEGAIDSKSVR
jgi:hypothetical protein